MFTYTTSHMYKSDIPLDPLSTTPDTCSWLKWCHVYSEISIAKFCFLHQIKNQRNISGDHVAKPIKLK